MPAFLDAGIDSRRCSQLAAGNAANIVDGDLGSHPPYGQEDIGDQRSIDDLYPCTNSRRKDCAKSRKKPSQTIHIALERAIRRLINESYIPEVRRYFEDPISFQMVHTWSCLCFDIDRPRNFARSRCYMKEAVRSLCSHRAFPEIWPAITLKELSISCRISRSRWMKKSHVSSLGKKRRWAEKSERGGDDECALIRYRSVSAYDIVLWPVFYVMHA